MLFLQRVDNRPEFAGRILDQRAYLNAVMLDFSRAGKPTDMQSVQQASPAGMPQCVVVPIDDRCTHPDRSLEDRLVYYKRSSAQQSTQMQMT